MSQDPAGHGGSRQGSVSVAELLARYDQPVAGRAARRTAHRAAAVGGGSAVLLGLVAAAMSLSGQQPDAGEPAAATPGPDHISGTGVTLLDSAVAPAAAPDRLRSAASGSGDRERHTPDRAAAVGETGDGELPAATSAAPARAVEPSADAGLPAARTSDPRSATSERPAGEAPAQGRAGIPVDDESVDHGPLAPVTDLVSQLTGSRPAS